MAYSKQSLKTFNTFGVEASSTSFIKLRSEEELVSLIRNKELADRKLMILGGGSNILFTKDFDGVILHPLMNAISIVNKDKNNILLSCDAGVEWDYFVDYCVIIIMEE